jgi:hypothetical protein
VHERVAGENGKVSVDGFTVQDRLVELVPTASETVPENLFPESGAEPSVIVDVPATPTVGETLVGLAEIEKSWTVTVNVAE